MVQSKFLSSQVHAIIVQWASVPAVRLRLPENHPYPKYRSKTNGGLNATITWLALFTSIFIVYFPALHGTRLWDDSGHITRPDLQSLHGLWRIWFDVGATQQYYPVLHSAFWVEHHIWGDTVAGYHLINLILHATAAALVVFIARYLKLNGSLLAGFLFALHPVCLEGVAWISEQKSTLSGVFCLAAIHPGWRRDLSGVLEFRQGLSRLHNKIAIEGDWGPDLG